MGNRGNSTGPHLHFEVLLNGTDRVDPVGWLAKRGISARATTLAEWQRRANRPNLLPIVPASSGDSPAMPSSPGQRDEPQTSIIRRHPSGAIPVDEPTDDEPQTSYIRRATPVTIAPPADRGPTQPERRGR